MDKILDKIEKIRCRIDSGSYEKLSPKQKEEFDKIKHLVKLQKKTKFHQSDIPKRNKNLILTDYCYNKVNKGDFLNKFMLSVGPGQFEFVGFDWKSDKEVTVSWTTKGTGKTHDVGTYKKLKFYWDFSKLEEVITNEKTLENVDNDFTKLDIKSSVSTEKLNYNFIEKWNLLYDRTEKDESEYKAIVKEVSDEIREKKSISKQTFTRILNWKSPRTKGHIDWENYKKYEKIISDAVKYKNKTSAVNALTSLRGIGIPVSSTIIHFVFPNEIPIIDVRTVETLQHFGLIPSDIKSEAYKQNIKSYKEFCFLMHELYLNFRKFTLRKLDRALFAFHKQQLKVK